MFLFTQSWYIVRVLNLEAAVGMVMIGSSIPQIMMLFIGGVIADRMNKTKLMFWSGMTRVILLLLSFYICFLSLQSRYFYLFFMLLFLVYYGGGNRQMKKLCIAFMLLVMLLLMGCASDGEETQIANLEDVNTIYIEQGSHDIIIESEDQPDVEANYGRGVTLEQSGEKITIGVKKSLLPFGPKVNLGDEFKVIIPTDFNGDVVMEGNSGDISSELLANYNLEFTTKSGDVSLVFTEFQSNVKVVSKSGNVDIVIQEDNPNMKLKTKTASGNNTIAFPVSLDEADNGKEIDAVSGEGTFTLDIETKSGDISVKNN